VVDNDSDGIPDSEVPGWDGGTDSTVVVGEGGVVITDEDGTKFVCYETKCDGRVLACGDCVDNDSDGMTDWRDKECLGPCDNTEGPALISDVGGVTGSTCHVDCYFDYGNGMGTGSDDCWWDHQCDPLEPEADVCAYDAQVAKNEQFCPDEQSQLCDDICLPYTPNGCDCFGCCTFPELEGLGENGEPAYVWIGAKDDANVGICTFDDILNVEKCPRCTPVENCLNTCEICEICIGKPLPPAECFPDTTDTDSTDSDFTPPGEQCPTGITPCNYNDADPCGSGYYCISGCCQAIINLE
jgi:hypothetical protein